MSTEADKYSVSEYMREHGFKKVVMFNDSETGLRAVIAIHSTALGPATGGLRRWTYARDEDAIFDAMRLARGMTYKYAAAGVNLGGGKAVIMADDNAPKGEALMRAMGRCIESLNGEYITGEDVGITLDDLEILNQETDNVVTLPEHLGGAGDISPYTALGTIQAMRSCAERVWGTGDLSGRKVAVQGLGVVGYKAAEQLVEAGAEVTVTDINPDAVKRAEQELGVKSVAPDDIFGLDVDILAPYALGGIINDDTLPQLKVKVVAGSANNIFAEERHAEQLQKQGIVYAVDYVANSGGTIYDTDRYRKGGFQPERAKANVMKIRERTDEVFRIADSDGVTYKEAADRLAERRIESIKNLQFI